MPRILEAMPLVLASLTPQILSAAFLYAPGSDELLICFNSDRQFEGSLNWVNNLLASIPTLSIILRTKGKAIVFGNPHVTDKVKLSSGRTIYLRHVDNQFSNPNPYIATQCLHWLVSKVQAFKPKSILELYSGDSHHTCALAPLVGSMTCVEIQDRLVKAAAENLGLNGITNVNIIKADCGMYSRVISDVVEFVLVDPPRSGLDACTLKMVACKAKTIVYISCNPVALLADMKVLRKTHSVISLTVMDHFPGTDHLEVGVVLSIVN